MRKLGRWLRWGKLAGASALALGAFACGDSSGGNADAGGPNATDAAGGSNAGTGAGTGSGGGSSGAGGTSGNARPDDAGASPLPRSKRSVCLEYVTAVCRRSFACGLNERDCTYLYSDRCPDWIFGEGTARTIDEVLQCVEIWSDYPCVELRRGVRPCELPGSFEAGTPCVSAAQCQSLVCGSRIRPPGPSCETCAQVAQPGEPCPSTDVLCPSPEPMGLSDPAPFGTGAECDYPAQCREGLVCRSVDGTRQCLPLGELGDPCERYDTGCAQGLQCLVADDDRYRCASPPKPGEPCRRNALDGSYTHCDRDARCNAEGICQALPATGEACYSLDGMALHQCDLESSCLFDAPDAVGTCVPSAGLGETCLCRVAQNPDGSTTNCPGQAMSQSVPNCGAGLRCHCDSCDGPAACHRVDAEGEPCSDPYVLCEENTECLGGFCVGLESLGLYESACMP